MPPKDLLNSYMSAYLNQHIDKMVMAKAAENPAVDFGQAGCGKFGWCIICRRPAAHYCIQTGDHVCGHPCKFRNLERGNLIESRFGARREEEEEVGAPII